jgi:hypothetical protein
MPIGLPAFQRDSYLVGATGESICAIGLCWKIRGSDPWLAGVNYRKLQTALQYKSAESFDAVELPPIKIFDSCRARERFVANGLV